MEVGFWFHIFEQLREIQKIKSRADLVCGVIDVTTYDDYRNTASIKTTVIQGLLRNLKLTISDLYAFLAKQKNSTVMILDNYHHAIMDRKPKESRKIKLKISAIDEFNDTEDKYYNFLLLMNDYYAKQISQVDFMISLKRLIEYPEILSKGIATFLDLIILKEIAYCADAEEMNAIANFCVDQYHYRYAIQKFEKNEYLLLLLQMIANLFGYLEQYEKSASYAKKAIDICLSCEESYLLEYFYCQLAFCKHFEGNIVERDKYVIECYSILKIKKDVNQMNKFLNIFDEMFNITRIELEARISKRPV